jgi:hypothetical protein
MMVLRRTLDLVTVADKERDFKHILAVEDAGVLSRGEVILR